VASRKPKPLPRSVRGDSRTGDAFRETMKSDNGIVGEVQRMLLANALKSNPERPPDVVHPSELCKPDWCTRRAYYRITQVPETNASKINHRTEQMFEEGHHIHAKWQGWLWDLGILQGMFYCHDCNNVWWDTAPTECEECRCPRWGLRYREVPIISEEMLVSGRADGQIYDDTIVEVKSIGPGTIRYERPELFRRYDQGEINLEGLWKEIKRPFVSHLKQAMFYAYVKGLKKVVFIYEWKPYQALKHFTVTVSESYIEDMIENALDTAYAVREDRLPNRPRQAVAADDPFCKACPFRDHCWSTDGEEKPATITRRVVRRRA
jgi:CRISPR/Cas system-associated exonuclease Cas4 (RecB family)